MINGSMGRILTVDYVLALLSQDTKDKLILLSGDLTVNNSLNTPSQDTNINILSTNSRNSLLNFIGLSGTITNNAGDFSIRNRNANGSIIFSNTLADTTRLSILPSGRTLLGTTIDNGSDLLQIGGSISVSTKLTSPEIYLSSLYLDSQSNVNGKTRISFSNTGYGNIDSLLQITKQSYSTSSGWNFGDNILTVKNSYFGFAGWSNPTYNVDLGSSGTLRIGDLAATGRFLKSYNSDGWARWSSLYLSDISDYSISNVNYWTKTGTTLSYGLGRTLIGNGSDNGLDQLQVLGTTYTNRLKINDSSTTSSITQIKALTDQATLITVLPNSSPTWHDAGNNKWSYYGWSYDIWSFYNNGGNEGSLLTTYQFTPGKSYKITVLMNSQTAELEVSLGDQNLYYFYQGLDSIIFPVYNAGDTLIVTGYPNSDQGFDIRITVQEVVPYESTSTWKNSLGVPFFEMRSSQIQTNLFLGTSVGRMNTYGEQNTILGNEAYSNNSLGIGNTMIGYNSGQNLLNGSRNTFIGSDTVSTSSNTPISENVVIGSLAGTNLTGNGNVLIGVSVGRNLGTASNTIVGSYSLSSCTAGARNAAFGYNNLSDVTTGSDNIVLGNYSGSYLTTGSYNVLIGYGISLSPNTSNTIVLADGAGNRRITITSTGRMLLGTTTDNGNDLLQVAGSLNVSGNSILNGQIGIIGLGSIFNNAGQIEMRAGGTATGLRLGTAGAYPLKFYTNNTDRMTITSTGSVGFNTTSPIGSFDVKLATNKHIQFLVDANGLDVGSSTIASINDANSAYMPISFMASRYNFTVGNIGVGIVAPTSKLHVVVDGASDTFRITSTIASSGDWVINPFIYGVSNGGLSFLNKTTGTTPFVISSLNQFGFGTNSPIALFHVAGNNSLVWNTSVVASSVFGTGGTTGTSLFVNTQSLNSSYHSGLAVDGTYTVPGGVGTSIVNIKALGVYSGGGYDSNLAFHVTSGVSLVEVMRIKSSGVGVGTTTPSTKLHVVGGVAMTGGWSKNSVFESNYPTLVFNSTSAGKYAGIGYDGTSNMNFWVGGTTEDVVGTGVASISINSSTGNVGIRNSNPLSAFDVNGNINTNGQLWLSNGAFAYWDGTYNRIIKRNGFPAFSLGESSTYYDNVTHNFRGLGGVNTLTLDNTNSIFTSYLNRHLFGPQSDNGTANQFIGAIHAKSNLTIDGVLSYGIIGKRVETAVNAGTIAYDKSGFYEGYNGSNYPTTGTWYHLINSVHSNSGLGNIYAMQIAGEFFSQRIYFRNTNTSSTQTWREFVTTDTSGRVNVLSSSTGLNVFGNGGFIHSPNKFGLDFYNGNTRFYSSGPNTTTKGGFEFHTISSDGSIDVQPLCISGSSLVKIGINNTNPVYTLDLNGDLMTNSIYLRNKTTPFVYQNSTDDTYVSLRVLRNDGTITDGMYIGYGNSSSGQTRIYDGSTSNCISLANSTFSSININTWLFGNQSNNGTFAQFSGAVHIKSDLIVNGTNGTFSTQNIQSNLYYLNLTRDSVSLTTLGSVGVGTSTPAASSLLDLSSTTKGFLPPRMTSAQRTAISSPATGLVVFQTDSTPGLYIYSGTWKVLTMS